MLDLADRLNETIINMLKKIKGKYSLKGCTSNEFQQKNQMDLLELEKYTDRNKEFTRGG